MEFARFVKHAFGGDNSGSFHGYQEDNFKGSYTLKINERFCKRSYQRKIQKMLFLGFQYMRRILLYAFLLFFLLPSCSNRNNTKVVKPKYHHRSYDRKKDKRTKRTKPMKVAI